ncbi:hypothetical protein Pse7367_3307 [Thalassoporum mexicanum PCC 7367]|uniref:hypothetical protein n=1 Tax=Thalassoporum mexicanum TaxID=3457544 RepID=UPI00029FB49E|nr:hypothetical protein [Pseudanabaena sp. PCC 7367]AFY71547.1 hypothetical protein Pse7367_3307 [Pseudanabaena sp. PCC 7367]
MNQKIAIAAIHGIGMANPDFADPSSKKYISGMPAKLIKKFAQLRGESIEQARSKLVIKPIYWAEIVQILEDKLASRIGYNKLSNPFKLRDFVFHMLGDAIAYSFPGDGRLMQQIHAPFAQALADLAAEAGNNAPLCIISHSLGTTIASNYVWNLQNETPELKARIGDTPLEKGETLTLFYTFGSQLPLWGLAHEDFGTPITVPAPQLNNYYSGLTGKWLNFYDTNDPLGFPFQHMNEKYKEAVEDKKVNAGNFFTSWNAFSHNGYWQDREVVEPIAAALVKTWEAVN